MQPMPEKKFMRCDRFEDIEPPLVKCIPGKPKTKRVRAPNEKMKKFGSLYGKLSRSGTKQRCKNCQMEGHNKKSCTIQKTKVCITTNID